MDMVVSYQEKVHLWHIHLLERFDPSHFDHLRSGTKSRASKQSEHRGNPAGSLVRGKDGTCLLTKQLPTVSPTLQMWHSTTSTQVALHTSANFDDWNSIPSAVKRSTA